MAGSAAWGTTLLILTAGLMASKGREETSRLTVEDGVIRSQTMNKESKPLPSSYVLIAAMCICYALFFGCILTNGYTTATWGNDVREKYEVTALMLPLIPLFMAGLLILRGKDVELRAAVWVLAASGVLLLFKTMVFFFIMQTDLERGEGMAIVAMPLCIVPAFVMSIIASATAFRLSGYLGKK